MKPVSKLRLIQLLCILAVVLCMLASRGIDDDSNGVITPTHWVILLAALWSAFSSFRLQRRIVAAKTSIQRASKRSTPYSRWWTGHLLRLTSTTAVALWGLILKTANGPLWLVHLIFTAAIILLLIWLPGTVPNPHKLS